MIQPHRSAESALSLSAEFVRHSAVFFSHNKSTNNIFYHNLSANSTFYHDSQTNKTDSIISTQQTFLKAKKEEASETEKGDRARAAACGSAAAYLHNPVATPVPVPSF